MLKIDENRSQISLLILKLVNHKYIHVYAVVQRDTAVFCFFLLFMSLGHALLLPSEKIKKYIIGI